MLDPAASDCPRPTFTPTRINEGYDQAEVDEFLDRAYRAIELRDGSMTAQEVRDVSFTPVRLKPGYLHSDVDDELDRIESALGGEVSTEGTYSAASETVSADQGPTLRSPMTYLLIVILLVALMYGAPRLMQAF